MSAQQYHPTPSFKFNLIQFITQPRNLHCETLQIFWVQIIKKKRLLAELQVCSIEELTAHYNFFNIYLYIFRSVAKVEKNLDHSINKHNKLATSSSFNSWNLYLDSRADLEIAIEKDLQRVIQWWCWLRKKCTKLNEGFSFYTLRQLKIVKKRVQLCAKVCNRHKKAWPHIFSSVWCLCERMDQLI